MNQIDLKIADLISKLKEKYEVINIYLTAGREWYIQGVIGLADDDPHYSKTMLGFVESLESALAWVPERATPPKPKRFWMPYMEAKKDGSKWRLYHNGQYLGVLVPTKKQAMEVAAIMVQKSEKAIEEWESLYCK